MKTKQTSEAGEIKQGVVSIPRKKTTFLKIVGMRGKYKDILFDNDGVSDQPVSEETRTLIENQYPGAIIEEIDDPVT